MTDIRIGNSTVSVESVKPLKAGVALDDNLKAQLSKDGLDEIVFKKGDQLFIAYQKNMNLDNLSLNLDDKKFDVNAAYDAGQLSIDGDAVQVLFADDENKESFWAAPYKSVGRAVTSMVNHPYGKSSLLSFAAGVGGGVAGHNMAEGTALNSVVIGTLAGATAAGLKAGQEHNEPDFWDTGAALGINAVSYAVGVGAGIGGQELGKLALENPKGAAIVAGTTALLVGTGILLDHLSDSNKPATYRVIKRITEQ